MRISPVLLATFFLSVVAVPHLLSNQIASSIPGCESPAELQENLNKILKARPTQGEAFSQFLAQRREEFAALAAKYPREVEPQRRLIQETRAWSDPDQFQALLVRYRNQAAHNPEDPLALYLAGLALFRTDTPESIRLLEAARAKAPNFAWPALQLAEIYSGGKREDKKKASENIAAFFAVCPSSTDPQGQYLLGKFGDHNLQAAVASALRTRLARETNPQRLRDYELLWSLEFRVRPPQEHNALRKQVAEDLKRLEAINKTSDPAWSAFLLAGYELSGALKEILRERQDQLVREHPDSTQAFDIVRQRWHEEHPAPKDDNDAQAWTEYNEAYRKAARAWAHQFPGIPPAGAQLWALTLNGEYLTESEGDAAVRGYLADYLNNVQLRLAARYMYGAVGTWENWGAAELLLRHKWQPERAISFLLEAKRNFEKAMERDRLDDNLTAEDLAYLDDRRVDEQLAVSASLLDSTKLTGRSEDLQTVRASIEGPVPKERKYESSYWWNRAKLASLEGRKADALAYYQLALQKRLEQPRLFRGKITDELGEEARAFWQELGGTEAAWTVWSRPRSNGFQEAKEVRWEKPKQQFPPFELADVNGKVWNSKELKGKSLLINIWGTWCGPCRLELPSLEKLYQKVKGRDDIQVLTFNMDDNPGVVQPFVKENGYTFPVIPAYSFLERSLDDTGVPQNWVADPRGNWRWVQTGFDATDSTWADEMIRCLESVKATE